MQVKLRRKQSGGCRGAAPRRPAIPGLKRLRYQPPQQVRQHLIPIGLVQHLVPDFIDYANYGPQLTRSFKALKVWWSLKHFGADAYARVIDRMGDLAAHMGRAIEASDELELLAPVTFNCVCFRARHLEEAGNRVVLKTLVDSGDAFLGPASVKGRIGLRACFMNLRTSPADVDFIVDRACEIARAAGKGEPAA